MAEIGGKRAFVTCVQVELHIIESSSIQAGGASRNHLTQHLLWFFCPRSLSSPTFFFLFFFFNSNKEIKTQKQSKHCIFCSVA